MRHTLSVDGKLLLCRVARVALSWCLIKIPANNSIGVQNQPCNQEQKPTLNETTKICTLNKPDWQTKIHASQNERWARRHWHSAALFFSPTESFEKSAQAQKKETGRDQTMFSKHCAMWMRDDSWFTTDSICCRIVQLKCLKLRIDKNAIEMYRHGWEKNLNQHRETKQL